MIVISVDFRNRHKYDSEATIIVWRKPWLKKPVRVAYRG